MNSYSQNPHVLNMRVLNFNCSYLLSQHFSFKMNKIKSISCLLLTFLICSLSGFGQILNIEKARIDSIEDGKAYRINFETKFNFYNRSASKEDQARFATLANDLNAVFAPNKHAYIVLGKLAYTENNSEPILNNGYLHVRTNFNYKKKLSQEAFGQMQYDNFRGLSDRYILGGGIRWRVIQTEKFLGSIGSGPMYEKEIWRNINSEGVQNKDLLKLSSYIIVRWDITETVNFNTIFYYQIGYDNAIEASRNRISSSSNFNFKISDYLSFTTSISMAYEDKPIIPITKFIYGVENGLTLTF